MTIYHLFKRNVKGIKQWYYWYWLNGKQVRKSCGSKGKPCLKKKDAELFISQLPESPEELTSPLTFGEIATEMFKKDSLYLKLRAAKGHGIEDITLKNKQSRLNVIMPYWKDKLPAEIEAVEIENYLISLNCSNARRNDLLQLINEVLKECKRNKIIKYTPEVEPFSKNYRKKDIFTKEELTVLFPNDPNELTKLWTVQGNDYYQGIDGKCHPYGFMFGIMYRLLVSTGMRPGELMALYPEQILGNAILLNQSIGTDNNLKPFLKKGSISNTKARPVILPSVMAELLQIYLPIRPKSTSNFIFTYNDRHITATFLRHRFQKGLKKSGLYPVYAVMQKNGKNKYYYDTNGRKLSPYSLRFTYNTYMVYSDIPHEKLRQMIGHNSKEMTDYYTRVYLDKSIQNLLPLAANINDVWNNFED